MHHCLMNRNYHRSAESPALPKDTALRIPAQPFPVLIWPQATSATDPAAVSDDCHSTSHNPSQVFFKNLAFPLLP